ncbi:MAG: aldo/keto reductase, partial [Aureispira sp.]|nr:aldo/keto reductase [Aureispira sp.]
LGMEGLEWLKERSLTEEKLNIVRGLAKIADDLGTSVAKLAVAWCLSNPDVSTFILGASKLSHLQETLTSIDLLDQMTSDVMEAIEAVLGNKPVRPAF